MHSTLVSPNQPAGEENGAQAMCTIPTSGRKLLAYFVQNKSQTEGSSWKNTFIKWIVYRKWNYPYCQVLVMINADWKKPIRTEGQAFFTRCYLDSNVSRICCCMVISACILLHAFKSPSAKKEKNFDTIEKWPIGNLKWSLRCLPKSFRNKTALIYSETQLKVILASCMIHFKVYFLSDFLQKFKVRNLPHFCHWASQLNSQ